MNTNILGLGTAAPDHCMSQDEGLAMFQDIVCETDRQRRLARALFMKSQVENRHLVIPHKTAYSWCKPTEIAIAAGKIASIQQSPKDLLAELP